MFLSARFRRSSLILVCVLLMTSRAVADQDLLSWPRPTMQTRPWTRWWWLGSAVDKENLTRLLMEYQKAGLGGVEICPIYGAKGYEDRYLPFLSDGWVAALAHTTTEGKRLGIGVDMTTGTGWPFGGPWVSADDASAKFNVKHYSVASGESLKEALPPGAIQTLIAISDTGQRTDLTNFVKEGKLQWTAPAGN